MLFLHKQKQTRQNGYDVNYYTLATNKDGTVALTTADEIHIDASNIGVPSR